MTEAAQIVELKPKRIAKVKIVPVSFSDIVDAWRLLQTPMKESIYPDNSEETQDRMTSMLLAYLQQPNSRGLFAKIGKRPVGIVLGHEAFRLVGRPSRYFVVEQFFVDPQFRKQGIGKQLWAEYVSLWKKHDISHCESKVPFGTLTKEPLKPLSWTIGGRV